MVGTTFYILHIVYEGDQGQLGIFTTEALANAYIKDNFGDNSPFSVAKVEVVA